MSILPYPIGAPADPPFTDADLLHTDFQFGTTFAYFSNDAGSVVCFPDPLDARITWCSTKAPATNPWWAMGPPPVEAVTGIPTTPYVPPVVGTPEPAGVGMWLLAALVVAIVARGIWKAWKGGGR